MAQIGIDLPRQEFIDRGRHESYQQGGNYNTDDDDRQKKPKKDAVVKGKFLVLCHALP